MDQSKITRRSFVGSTALCVAGSVGFPYIIPSCVLGGDQAIAPSNRITLGLIGNGNINGHHRNFLDCIKTRRPAAASAEVGHHATTTCNLVEISARLGRKVTWNAESERFADDETADRLLSRAMRAPWRA